MAMSDATSWLRSVGGTRRTERQTDDHDGVTVSARGMSRVVLFERDTGAAPYDQAESEAFVAACEELRSALSP